MEIDWSKAPEGATHYQPHQGAYYKHSPLRRCWLVWASDHPMGEPRWHQARGTDEKQLIARPAAWDGAGLPPVGTVCEMWHEKIGDWLKSEVAFVGEQILVVRYHSIAHGHHEAAIMNVDSEKLLRLPRTPEQIAAEERKRAISEMLRIYTDGAAGHCGGIAALYDAGYRKQA